MSGSKPKTLGCSVYGCPGKHIAKGFCTKHYLRFKRRGSPHVIHAEQHRKSNHEIYNIWHGIKNRCYNENHKSYHQYGGRGILMSDEWKNSFTTFLRDMGERPSGAQIDRIDNNGNYCSSNCRWATVAENGQNRRTCKLNPESVVDILLSAEKPTVLARIYSVSVSTICDVRKRRRWKNIEALKVIE